MLFRSRVLKAAQSGHGAVCDALLIAGANPKLVDKDGQFLLSAIQSSDGTRMQVLLHVIWQRVRATQSWQPNCRRFRLIFGRRSSSNVRLHLVSLRALRLLALGCS